MKDNLFRSRDNHHNQRINHINSIINYKLLDSNYQNNQLKDKHHGLGKNSNSKMNTPSSIEDYRFGFHEFEKGHKSQENSQVKKELKYDFSHRRCESVTKILSLREIKTIQEESKEKNSRQKSITKKSPSSKLLVTISQSNYKSRQKIVSKSPQMDKINLNYINEGKQQTKPKMKLQVYKQMAQKKANNFFK